MILVLDSRSFCCSDPASGAVLVGKLLVLFWNSFKFSDKKKKFIHLGKTGKHGRYLDLLISFIIVPFKMCEKQEGKNSRTPIPVAQWEG